MPADELSTVGDEGLLTRLRESEMAVVGRMPYSSNATFLVELCWEDEPLHAVYKPCRGERPLWDFPPGLHLRELAAFVLSEMLGWGIVPPTVVRDGPLGVGSLQAFIEADFEQHYFTLLREPRHHDQLRAVCLFDLLANSTDRKGSHVLIDGDGHIWAIDNGLSFHSEPKLRTVMWDFAGEPIPDDPLAAVGRLAEEGPSDALAGLLGATERHALVDRARRIAASGTFPADPTGRRIPWPML